MENTDRELWRECEGDYYAPSIHVTADGGIGIDVGGSVIVMPLRAWHALAAGPAPTPAQDRDRQSGDALRGRVDLHGGHGDPSVQLDRVEAALAGLAHGQVVYVATAATSGRAEGEHDAILCGPNCPGHLATRTNKEPTDG